MNKGLMFKNFIQPTNSALNFFAYSLMRPNGYENMEVKGVMKRLKDKTFAASVSRDDIRDGCERVGISMEDLIGFVVKNQSDFK